MERILYFIAALFLLNLRLAWAFNISFTPAAQCGPLTVTWNVTEDGQTAPPYKLLIIPVNQPDSPNPDSTGLGPQLSLPVIVDIPVDAWDATTRNGTYTIEQLKIRSGEHFIVVMDDGFGLGTGGVSPIQTVGRGGQAATCLESENANANVHFSLSTLQPQQCSSLSISVDSPRSIRGFVPGGTPFSLDMPASTAGNVTVEWVVNVEGGSNFVLLYEGLNGDVASSGLLQSGFPSGSSSGDCMTNGPHETGNPIGMYCISSAP
ncbi:hypothetical protein CPB86DRAFT_715131 [Serendipita vermifera]|nr:hypothetical protein CPB86DRAFT_715131 [Serendipita vermifera]